MNYTLLFCLLISLISFSCDSQTSRPISSSSVPAAAAVSPGAYNTAAYLPLLQDKRVGLVVNHTSMIQNRHLVDSLLSLGVNISVIWAPEHGFSGTAYNGEHIEDDRYNETISIRSLYGASRKPTDADMDQVDVVVFDIQDVGARFYTYISTLHYVMEAAAENKIDVIILDRPNPNAHYIDGPTREEGLKSFVGMHPVPIVYGMTIGEYGMMINGEGWLDKANKCQLTVVPNAHYTHSTPYTLPIAPSPNLPNQRSILLYPSLCLFEGTAVSAGRGTDMQFQVYGHPLFPDSGFQYTPRSMSSSKYPKHQDTPVNGVDLRGLSDADIMQRSQLNLNYIIDAYAKLKGKKVEFFLASNFIDKLSGTALFKEQILSGMDATAIRSTWKDDIAAFRHIRARYLLYPE